MSADEIGALLREASAAWSLDRDELARRAEIEPEAADAVLDGRADVTDIAAVASVLGGTLDDVLAKRRFWEAPAAAFKSAGGISEPVLVRLALLRVSSAAQDRAGLVSLLGLGAHGELADRFSIAPAVQPIPEQAEELARKVRGAIGNDNEPLSSVREIMRRCGVATFLTDVGTDDIDGMMCRDAAGHACAIVNMRARRGKLAAMRMTFAHELAHALFDGTKRVPLGVVDRRTEHSEAVEQRANAFAAYFLAPRPAVLRFLRDRGLRTGNMPSPSQVRDVAEHFGVGVEAMAYHLVNCGVWSVEDARRYKWLATRDLNGEDNVEAYPTPGEELVPIERRGEILALATAALEQDIISVGRWREVLHLSAWDDWRGLLNELHVERDVEHRSSV